MSRRRTPKYALYSGFELSRKDFITFIRSIPRLQDVEPSDCPDWDLEACINAYRYCVQQVDPKMPMLIRETMMFYYMTGSSF
jgi:hypothetical protein